MTEQEQREKLEKFIKPEMFLLSGNITALKFLLKYQKEKFPPEIWVAYLENVQRELQKLIEELR